uniref:Uncharacterized protein n=1 Tax=Leptocylindrus danicus TaxID=163516 RepID=A0A6U2SUY5_9STRA|mmetsp:Transcript_7765/g.11535  ORF Transcript_7765/g.11535 Transcript_7765/m.11535 type:complete len:101 (+) Transcript_7765:77-379(+)
MKPLTPEQIRLWKIAAGIIVVGSGIKGVYYKITREILVETMERNDKEANRHLADARKYAIWAKKDRDGQVPQLTPEQSAQLRRHVLKERSRRDAKFDGYV